MCCTFCILLPPSSGQATSSDERSQGAALGKRLRQLKSMRPDQYHPIGFWSNRDGHAQRANSDDYRAPPIYAQRRSNLMTQQATTPKWRWICWQTCSDASASRILFQYLSFVLRRHWRALSANLGMFCRVLLPYRIHGQLYAFHPYPPYARKGWTHVCCMQGFIAWDISQYFPCGVDHPTILPIFSYYDMSLFQSSIALHAFLISSCHLPELLCRCAPPYSS